MPRPMYPLWLALAVLAAARCASADLVVIHRDTGSITWFNSTGQSLDVAAYTLHSPSGGFLPQNWLSISDNYDADSSGRVDPVHIWNVLGSSAFNLAEATIGAAAIPIWGTIDFGKAWQPGHTEDVTFEYLDAQLDEVLTGSVRFVSSIAGDYNANGIVEQADLDLVLLNWGEATVPTPAGWISDLPQGLVDQRELDRVLLNWGQVGQAAVVPLASPLLFASVPEPDSLWLGAAAAGIAGFCVALVRRQLFSTNVRQ